MNFSNKKTKGMIAMMFENYKRNKYSDDTLKLNELLNAEFLKGNISEEEYESILTEQMAREEADEFRKNRLEMMEEYENPSLLKGGYFGDSYKKAKKALEDGYIKKSYGERKSMRDTLEELVEDRFESGMERNEDVRDWLEERVRERKKEKADRVYRTLRKERLGKSGGKAISEEGRRKEKGFLKAIYDALFSKSLSERERAWMEYNDPEDFYDEEDDDDETQEVSLNDILREQVKRRSLKESNQYLPYDSWINKEEQYYE